MIGRDAENNLRRRQSSPIQGRRNESNFKGSAKKVPHLIIFFPLLMIKQTLG